MITRRDLLRAGGAGAALAALPAIETEALAAAPALVSGFAFTDGERATLRAAANQLIPPFRNGKLTFRGGG
ncbi:MAG: twin-arginine translocation signal domain-containing protein, partial [Candidatus Binatia bacterium]